MVTDVIGLEWILFHWWLPDASYLLRSGCLYWFGEKPCSVCFPGEQGILVREEEEVVDPERFFALSCVGQ